MKKLLCLLIAGMLLVSISACAQTEADPAGTMGGSPTGSSDPTQSTETMPQPTEPVSKTRYLCIEEKYTVTNGGGVTTRTYDEKGNLLTEDYKSNSGDVGYGDSYTYDEKGNVLTHKTYDKHSQMSSETTNTYNESGQLISQLFTNRDGDFYTRKSDFTYNEDGLLIKKVESYPNDPDNEVFFLYSYDENGNLIKEEWITVYKGTQTPHSWKAWTYDAKGNKLTETDNRGFKTQWTYDDRGNVLSETPCDNVGNYMLGTTYTYNEKNQLLTKSFFKENPSFLQEGFLYEYDDNGNEIARYRCYDTLDKAHAVAIFKRTYDEFGNLTKEITCSPEGEERARREYKYIAIEPPTE